MHLRLDIRQKAISYHKHACWRAVHFKIKRGAASPNWAFLTASFILKSCPTRVEANCMCLPGD